MLPLCAVLTITAIKDGVEDYRRHALDNQVNDSAVTRLGKWRNVNLATHDTSLWQRIIRLGRPVHDPRIHVSRGVRKLREKEGAFSTDFLYSSTTALTKPETTDASSMAATDEVESIAYLDAYSNSSHGDGLSSLPMNRTRSNTSASSINPSINAESFRSQGGVHGVIDYSRPASTTGAWERTLFKKLNVGDVILLSDDDVVPADLVILSTSDPDGICWVETKVRS
jgi:phospholipid-translocating ATPase